MNRRSMHHKMSKNSKASNLVSKVKLKIKQSQIESKPRENLHLKSETNKVIGFLKDARVGRSQHQQEHHNFDKDSRSGSEHLERLYFGKKYQISHEPLELEDEYIERKRYNSL